MRRIICAYLAGTLCAAFGLSVQDTSGQLLEPSINAFPPIRADAPTTNTSTTTRTTTDTVTDGSVPSAKTTTTTITRTDGLSVNTTTTTTTQFQPSHAEPDRRKPHFKKSDDDISAACWRNTYSRASSSKPIRVCKAHQDKHGALCYQQCKRGYYAVDSLCWQHCWHKGSGYTDIGVSCFKAPFHFSTKDTYGRLHPLVCKESEDNFGGLCYPKCRNGYEGVGVLCWKKCSGYRPKQSGAICCAEDADCTFESISRSLGIPSTLIQAGTAVYTGQAEYDVGDGQGAVGTGQSLAYFTQELADTKKC